MKVTRRGFVQRMLGSAAILGAVPKVQAVVPERYRDYIPLPALHAYLSKNYSTEPHVFVSERAKWAVLNTMQNERVITNTVNYANGETGVSFDKHVLISTPHRWPDAVIDALIRREKG